LNNFHNNEKHLRVHCIPFSLTVSIWEYLEGSVWLFRVGELFSSNFQTILHFADEFSKNLNITDMYWIYKKRKL